MVKILSGRPINVLIEAQLAGRIKSLGLKPKLAIIEIGRQEPMEIYVRQKIIFSRKIGAAVEYFHFDDTEILKTAAAKVQELSIDPSVHGIIVQLPTGGGGERLSVLHQLIERIAPAKDVDGLTAASLAALWRGQTGGFLPATTRGILRLLDYYQILFTGRKVTVVGRSLLVGKPTALAFLNRGATITVCHRETVDLAEATRSADILVTAAGQPRLITRDHVRPGQTVVDVGIGRLTDGQLAGDVDFESVKEVVAAISPVPGGVGPLTVASLFENLVEACRRLSF